jgi:Chemotaxis phosphatase CheX
MSAIDAQAWLSAVVEAGRELAETTFAAEASEAIPLAQVSHGTEGSLLPVSAGNESVQLAVLASLEGCRALTKALMQMEDEEEPSEEDIPDAVGEIVNIIGGIVQRSLDGSGSGAISLGLPVYIRGEVIPPFKAQTVAVRLHLGPAEAELVVIIGDGRHHHSLRDLRHHTN